MFLKAGVLSLTLLLASRLLGLLRESAQAAAFGTSALADVVVLMLTLPDWLAGVLASGALAFVLMPAWAGQSAGQVAATQRKVAWGLLGGGGVLALLLFIAREPALALMAPGLPVAMRPPASAALVWSALALPAALLAALWTTRLQHERDFTGMYSANLVVNAVLIAAIAWAAGQGGAATVLPWLGGGLLAAMFLRLAWLHWRCPRVAETPVQSAAMPAAMPAPPVWLWAVLSAGLPLALPFVARSVASQSGEGALATFNYAWKLIELPLILAIQLVATLAFPAIAKALASGDADATESAVRSAIALAWALACAAAAALLVGAPAIAQLFFGWGRMEPQALARVAQWGAAGAWGLLPQALIAIGLTVLAARGRMRVAVAAYALALAVLLWFGARGLADGAQLMLLMNVLLSLVAMAVIAALGSQARGWMPWRAMAASFACLLGVAGIATRVWDSSSAGTALTVVLAALAGLLVMGAAWWASSDLRTALAR